MATIAEAVTAVTGVFTSLPAEMLLVASAGLIVGYGVRYFRGIVRLGR